MLGYLSSWYIYLSGIRHPNHTSYKFHITLAYVLEEYNEEEIVTVDQVCTQLAVDLKSQVDYIEIERPVFTIFNDMHHYETDLNKR